MCQVLQAAVDSGATTLNIPDTVGYATPVEMHQLFTRIKTRITPRFPDIMLAAHCHNDLGMAVANTLSAVQAGARQIEVAVNGIGERAGNCSLEEVAMIVRTRGEHLGVRHGLNLKEIVRTSRLVF